jgi:hypothetical protein
MNEYVEQEYDPTEDAPFTVAGFTIVNVDEDEGIPSTVDGVDDESLGFILGGMGCGDPDCPWCGGETVTVADSDSDSEMGGLGLPGGLPGGLGAFFARLEQARNASALSFLQKLALTGLDRVAENAPEEELDNFIREGMDAIMSAFAQLGISQEVWEMATAQTREQMGQGDAASGASIATLLGEDEVVSVPPVVEL